MVTLAGIHPHNDNKRLDCRTPKNTAIENAQEFIPVSNQVHLVSRNLKIAYLALAALEADEIEFLVEEFSDFGENAVEGLIAQTEITREIYPDEVKAFVESYGELS